MDLQTAGEWRRGEQLQKFEEEWELEAAANEWSVIQLNWVQNSHFVPVLRVMLLSGGKWGLVLLQLALLGLNMQEFFFCAISLKFLSQIKSMILDSMDESLFWQYHVYHMVILCWLCVGPEQGLIIICLLHIDKYGETLKMPIAGFS